MKPVTERLRRIDWLPALGGMLGLAYALLIYGSGLFATGATDWLMYGDAGTHYLGWAFLRGEPWSWPPGMLHRYGMEIAASVVYSDSIPLFALFFKLFAPWLPEPFQYSGLWMATCFALQGYFGWLLARRFTSSALLAGMGAALFILSPVLLSRGNGHFALMGHWEILAALLLYFTPGPRFSALRWALLASVAALTHAYLAAMVLALFGAALLRAVLAERWLDFRGVLLALGILVATLPGTMWLAGYFTGSSVQGGDPALYSMNLMAPWLPTPNMVTRPPDPQILPSSPFLPLHGTVAWEQYEGFNYLGLGMLLLLPLAAFARFHPLRTGTEIEPGALWPLLALCVLLTLYALSFRVTLGNQLLFEWPLPDRLKQLAAVFRSCGRMFWPVYYALMLGVFALLVRRLPVRIAAMVLGAAVLLQFADMTLMRADRGELVRREASYHSPLQAPFWEEAAHQYRRVIVVPPTFSMHDFIPLSDYAARHGMEINLAYYGRPTAPAALAARQARIDDLLQHRHADPEALYVFRERKSLHFAEPLDVPDSASGMVSGMLVLAPGWFARPHPVESGAGLAPLEALQALPADGRIDFNTVESTPYLLSGFSHTESSGTWSEGRQAVLGLHLPDSGHQDWYASLSAHPFVTPAHPALRIEVLANGHPLTEWNFRHGEAAPPRTLAIPRSALAGKGGDLVLSFRFHDPISPQAVGMSADPRLLGLMFNRLELHPATR